MLELNLVTMVVVIVVAFMFWGVIKRLTTVSEEVVVTAITSLQAEAEAFAVKRSVAIATDLGELSNEMGEKPMATVESIKAKLEAKILSDVSES